jgi:PAS domain S-box-containing protein
MSAFALSLVLSAAVLHASWNALVKAASDRALVLAAVASGHAMAGIVLIWISEPPSLASWVPILLSTLIHYVYYVLLFQAYRLGDLSQVYPISRGLAPALVALGALALVGEMLPPAGWAGLIAISGGICLLALQRGAAHADPRAVGVALLLGLTIASYSVADGIGVRISASPTGYMGWLFLLEAPVFFFILWNRRRLKGTVDWRVYAIGLLGGLFSVTAYGTVLYAKTIAPIGAVSAIRESSVVIAALIGVLFFGERPWGGRLAAAVIVAAGVVTLAVSGRDEYGSRVASMRHFFHGTKLPTRRFFPLVERGGTQGELLNNEEGQPAPLGEDERYRLLVDAITDYAVYMLDRDGFVVSWNPGAQRFKGYTADEIIGQHFSRFYTPEDKAKSLPQRALEVAARDGRFESEGWRVRKDGSRFWTHAVIDPIRAPSGELIGYAKITQDLTEQKATEAALKRSEEQFKLLVQGVTDYAIYMLNKDGTIASWNLGAQRIKGYSPEEIIGEHFSRFYPPEDRARGEPEKGLKIAAAEGRFEKEAWRVRKDGTRFWAHVIIDAIKDESGELIGFAKVTRDITERRDAQRALEEAREALFQAQKLEAIGQLTGGVAHDFNNLLMVIISSLELMRRRIPDDPKLKSLVENATQAAQRGATLTQRMLAFARRQELQREEIDLPDLVRGMRELLQRSLGPTIRIETRFPLELPRVRTDANQLESALLNLAVNARDAMPKGGPIIIAAREETIEDRMPSLEPGNYVCLSVQDSGEGMDAQTLARATDPFFTTKGVGKGTGLGLSMVQGLAEQSGGRLALHSRRGEGTTVEIWLPAVPPAAIQIQPRQPAREAEPARGPVLTVLAVDDDALVLMNTAAMLEDLGHRVVEAHSGRKALEMLKGDEAIDLVITDQAMPGITGLELAEAIRSERPGLPVLLATGYAELPEGLQSELPRLSKPFGQRELQAAVKAATEGKSKGSQVVRFARPGGS